MGGTGCHTGRDQRGPGGLNQGPRKGANFLGVTYGLRMFNGHTGNSALGHATNGTQNA